ncbi:unnamed protein product [Cercopithifilaria johnstoni]|uniref:Uncharacterized protein n=1 Tax=Cercopithifilaria johnstoni TaxID=2874296 RepID=A0A8J2LMZ2_9BILA|nr:unnamed protein product [Cercopithifilaria johnstoni]
METLKSFNTRNIPVSKKRHSQDNGSGTVASKRPKLEENTVTVGSDMQCVAEQNNNKSYRSALLPFPATQPTHTGYIISATLLPSVSS